MSDYLERTNNGTTFQGSDVGIFRAIAIASALRLYARSGMRVNRAYTPKAMLAAAEQITGQVFKGKNKYMAAAQALQDLSLIHI